MFVGSNIFIILIATIWLLYGYLTIFFILLSIDIWLNFQLKTIKNKAAMPLSSLWTHMCIFTRMGRGEQLDASAGI